MGYNTIFKGELKFTSELSAKALSRLQKMLGEDCREHPEWNAKGLYYVDLVLTDDFDGVRWNDETEKTYGLEEIVNVVIRWMCKEYPDFGLTGQLSAQGEEFDDRWILEIGADGLAHRRDVVITGEKVICPHCHETFILEGATQS